MFNIITPEISQDDIISHLLEFQKEFNRYWEGHKEKEIYI